jgi:uncharacterized protein YkwD
MLRSLVAFVALLVLTAAGPPSTADEGKKEPAQEEKQGEPKLELSRTEQTLLDLTNKERAKEKLPPLKPNPILFKVARAHSVNMAKQGRMDHFLGGKNPAERALAAGYDYKHIGENLGENLDARVPLPVIVQGWMNSKHHRDNILKPEFTEIGLGVARSGKGDLYYTQLFGTPRKKQ